MSSNANQPSGALAEFTAAEIKPRFECTRSGVYHIAVETDDNGNTSEKPPVRLSDTIELTGTGQDQSGAYYRIIRYKDRLSGKAQTAAIAAAEIGTHQGWQRLQAMGITILSGRRKRELLADYLQAEGSRTAYTVVRRAGWHNRNRCYILPSGDVLQHGQSGHFIYNGDKSQAAAYAAGGSLEDWQREIARYMAGNSRLCLTIGLALAAPLGRLLNIEAGGFHLFGDSRAGKSTAARAALSVWGDYENLMLSWKGTDHGFDNTAAARNDGFLVLDEIGQAKAKVVEQTAYALINGIAKVQGAAGGGNREINRWRVFALSTGEKPLHNFIRTAGADWNAGQAARLPSLPADAGKGAGLFDTLHGHEKGSYLAEHLNRAAAHYHGTAGRAFVRLLLENPAAADEARELLDGFMAALPDTDGQARTVALRFALTAAALELAARHGITGLPAGAGAAGVKQCFEDWLQLNGTGKFEDNQINRQAVDFFQQYADTSRFSDWNAPYTDHNHAGYKRRGSSEALDEFWVIPPVFEKEIAQGFETRKACEVLHAAGWLKRHSENRWQSQRAGKGRFYVFIGAYPESDGRNG